MWARSCAGHCGTRRRPDIPPNLVKGLAWCAVCILSWAPMFPIAKRSLALIDAFSLGTIRYALGIPIFAALLWAVEGRKSFEYGTRLWPAIGFGIVGITGFNTLVWYGLSYTRPEHAGILMALQSPLTALAVWAVYGQRPARFTVGCIAVAIAGVLLVVTKGDPAGAWFGANGAGSLLGDAIILLGAICWVSYSLAGARFIGWSPLRLTTLTCIPGGIGLVVVNLGAVASGAVVPPTLGSIAGVWWQLIYFAAGSVVLGVLGFNASVKHLGALNTMLMLNLIPVSVFAIEAALGRSFEPVEIAGAAVVISALAANNLYQRRVVSRANTVRTA